MRESVPYVRVVVLLVGGLAPASAQERWWDSGHRHMTSGAIGHLPQPLQSFFAHYQSTIAALSGDEPPGSHWFHRNAYPDEFSHDLQELIVEYGEQYVEDNGTAPWTACDRLTDMTVLMAAASTSTDWALVLYPAGALAHYVEDLHNPLHVTTNYNGQETGNDGIHQRYEGVMISQHLDDLVIVPAPDACVQYASPIDAVFADIDGAYDCVDDLMAADTAAREIDPGYGSAYYAALWNSTGSFTQELFQAASEMVASGWFTAWVDAGQPPPILPGIVGDLNCDGRLDFGDINPFVLYLSNFAGWRTTYVGCDPLNGDIDGDGIYGQSSFGDINPFVTLLIGGE